MSIGKLVIMAALPAAIMAFFGLWDKTRIKQSIFILLLLDIFSYAGAVVALRCFQNDGTAYELLLIVGIISIILAAFLVICVKKERLTGDLILKTTCLICAGAAMYSILTKGQASIHSDVATATLLIQSQIEKRSFFPASWQYANGDIWILGSNVFTFPFFVVLKNQSLARMLGSACFVIAAVLGVIFMSRKLFHNDSWLLMVPLFLVFHPHNDVTNNNILWEASYTGQMLWMALGFTLSFHAICRRSRVAMCVYGLLAVVLYSQGIRFAAEQGIPLIGAYGIFAYCEFKKTADTDKNKLLYQLLRAILVIGVPLVLGLVIYKYLCSHHSVNDGRSAMSFVSSSETVWKNVETYLLYLFESFGYNHGVRLFSADGIWNLFVLVLCPLVCFVVPVMQALKLQAETAEVKLFYIYGLLHNALLFITIVLFGNIDSSRYVLSTVFVNIAICSRYIYVYWLKESIFNDLLWSTLFAAFACLACFMIVSQSGGWAGTLSAQKQFGKKLMDRGLEKGYATYWNAYNNEIYSDLNIRYGAVNIMNGEKMTPFLWLVDKDVYTPEEKNTFLLLGEQENASLSASIPLIFGDPVEVLHENGGYIYLFDYDIALNMDPLGDGILKPVELFENGGAMLEDGQYVLPAGAIIFGPYGELKAGEYEVVFTGERLDKAYCDIYSGKNGQALSFSEVSSSDKELVFDLILSEDVNDLEFRTFNEDSESRIKLYQIEIWDKSRQSLYCPFAAA